MFQPVLVRVDCWERSLRHLPRHAVTELRRRWTVICHGARSQGPAVWALRAQTDKLEYSREMRKLLEATPNLDIREVRGREMDSQLTSELGHLALPLMA
jgi:hypothetical protein